MSPLMQPDLYIAGQKMQTHKKDPRPALAGLKLKWGTDDDYERAPASTLSGQMLIRGAMPSYLNVGAPVGLVDPVSTRCLFAGTLEPLTATPEPAVAGAMRVSFTAASPLAELEKARVLDMDWTHDEPAGARHGRLASAMPRGWTLTADSTWSWVHQGRQLYQSVGWLTLAERYTRSYLQRIHDVSVYVPGAGLQKRILFAEERKTAPALPAMNPGTRGNWANYAGGTAIMVPPSTVTRDITWEKTPADVITDVQVTSFGGAFPQGEESGEFEYWMDAAGVDNRALQNTYGFRQRRVETALSSFNVAAVHEAIRYIAKRWLNTETGWRPTGITIPDSRRLNPGPMLNLLAVDTRHRATLMVPDTTESMAPIRAYVLAGEATWTGKKWTTDLTLGRTL